MSKDTSWEKEFDNKFTSKSLDADGIWHGEEIKQFIKKVETDATRGERERIWNMIEKGNIWRPIKTLSTIRENLRKLLKKKATCEKCVGNCKGHLPEREFSCICGNQIKVVFVKIKPFEKVKCDKCKREMRIPN